MLRCTYCLRCHGMGLVNTSWDTFCFLVGKFGQHMLSYILCFAGIGWVLSTHVDRQFPRDELHFMYWPACDGFGQHMLWCILFLRWHLISLVKKWWMYLVASLSWIGFGEHKLRYILCPRWHWTGLVSTWWVFAYWLAFCQDMLRGILCIWRYLKGLVITCWHAFYVLAVLGCVR
jgi:hypothetical protein